MEGTQVVKLPKRRIHKTPMPLRTDAYTVGSPLFQSKDALDKSVYYVVNRKSLYPGVDDRMVMANLDRIVERLFYEPITYKDVEESVMSLDTFQVTSVGFKPYPFPKEIWDRVVKEFNGRPPIKISAVREGSVIYPNEPFIQVESMVEGFGDIAAWVESKLLQVYGSIERITRNEHFLIKLMDEINFVDPSIPLPTVEFIASTMLIDFSDRAGLNDMESEDLGLAHLYTFSGTDNLSGHYQAYKFAKNNVVGCSILALAHRNVQAFPTENDCFEALNNALDFGASGSFVADCNDYYTAIEKYLVPLVHANLGHSQKTIVFRPDSGDVIEQILWTLKKCHENGLYTIKMIGDEEYYSLLGCKLILADGLNMDQMIDICRVVTNAGWIFWECVLFGAGGGLRNGLKRDNGSTKFALNAKGVNLDPVCKFSEDSGKGTLPGPLALIRDEEEMKRGITIVHRAELGSSEDQLITYFDGSNLLEPFGPGMDSDFETTRLRIREQMATMPKILPQGKFGNFPITATLDTMRASLKHVHAPNK